MIKTRIAARMIPAVMALLLCAAPAGTNVCAAGVQAAVQRKSSAERAPGAAADAFARKTGAAAREDGFARKTDTAAAREDAFARKTDAAAVQEDAFVRKTGAAAAREDGFARKTDTAAAQEDAFARKTDAAAAREADGGEDPQAQDPGFPQDEVPQPVQEVELPPGILEAADRILPGESIDVVNTFEEPFAYFVFVPEESCSFRFYAAGEETDTFAELFDQDGVWLAENDDAGKEDEDFALDYACQAGRQYCLRTRQYSYGEAAYTVRLEKNEEPFLVSPVGRIEREAAPTEKVTLEVSAVSDAELSYQWNVCGDDAEEDNTPSYTFEAERTGIVTCTVTDLSGRSGVCSFEITVQNHLAVYPDGADGSTELACFLKPGEKKSLKVKAQADDDSGLSYRWSQSEGDPQDKADREPLEEETGSRLKIRAKRTGCYYCTVTDQYGSEAEAVFRIVVNHLQAYPEENGDMDPNTEIIVEPEDTPVLRTAVSADDKKGLRYRWFKEKDGKKTRIPDADKSSYKVPSVSGSCAYLCRVSDKYGNSSYARFEVRSSSFEAWTGGGDSGEKQRDIYVRPGEEVTLRAEVSAQDPASIDFQWYDEDGGQIDGAESADYVIPSADRALSYRCVVSDPYGNTQELFYTVYPNHLRAWPKGGPEDQNYQEIVAAEGGDVDLEVCVFADDTAELTYVWYVDYYEEPVPGWDGDTVHLESLEESGSYRCDISDPFDNLATVFFSVGINHLNTWPEGCEGRTETEVYVEPGGTAVLQVTSSADQEKEIGYCWYDEDEAQEGGDTGQYTETCTVCDVTENRTYRCFVYDLFENSIDLYFHICVQNHFSAWPAGEDKSRQQAEVRPDENGEVKMKVMTEADEEDGIRYLWYRRDNDTGGYDELPGETSSSLTTSVTETMTFRCLVTDQYGNERAVQFTAVP